MIAENMEQLQEQLLEYMREAMNAVAAEASQDMYDATDYFYAAGPGEYVRTYALGSTPMVSELRTGNHSVEFDAYLDRSYVYPSGKKPTMKDVLKLANEGVTSSSVGKLRPTVGRQGFWEKAERDMERDLRKIMGKYFKSSK